MDFTSTKQASEIWDVKSRTIAKYCAEGKIPGAEKIRGQWKIPVDSIRPLSDGAIERLLRITLTLKNNPAHTIDYASAGIPKEMVAYAYGHLARRHYIEAVDSSVEIERIPYEAVLTDRGMDFLLGGNARPSVVIDVTDVAKQLGSVLLAAGIQRLLAS